MYISMTSDNLQAEVSFNGNISDLPAADSVEFADLKTKFGAAIAASLGLAPERVVVTSFKSGSIVAVVVVVADDGNEALKDLAGKVKEGAVEVEGYPVIKDAPVASNNMGEESKNLV